MHNLQRAISEIELTHNVQLCDRHGNLNDNAIGWSRIPLTDCNLSHHFLRKKRWNYWAVLSEDCLFSVTVSNIDYLGMVFAYFLDFKTLQFIEKTISTPLGQGCSLGTYVSDSIQYVDRAIDVSLQNVHQGTDIIVNCDNFGGFSLNAELHVQYPKKHQTMSVVIPWNRRNFQYTSKHNCLPVDGMVSLGDAKYSFNILNAFACLDFGAGVWPYSSYWNWSSFSGRSQNHIIGVNLGAGWTDGTGLTENSLTCDGKITKLSEDVLFDYNPNDYMRPWRLNTRNTDRVRLVFTPFYERKAKTDALFLTSSVHQMFGRFSGTIKPDGHQQVQVDDLVGWAEDHQARW